MTYREGDAADLCARQVAITKCRTRPQEPLLEEVGDNIARTAEWLLADVCGQQHEPEKSFVHVQ